MAKQTFTTGQVLTAAQMTSLQQTAMGGGSPSTKTASYVLVAADAGTVIQMNAAGSTTITVNTALFSAGDSVQIQNIGAGVCTITAGTATVNTAGSLALSQWEGGFLYFTSASSAIFFDVVQSSGMTNPMTTAGDTIYGGASGTPTRLAIGSTGNVLTVSGGNPVWAAPAGGGGMTLLSTTTLSGSTVSLTAISSSYNNLQLIIVGATATGSFTYDIRPNATTGNFRGLRINTTTLAQTNNATLAANVTSAAAANTSNAYCITIYDYANNTRVKNVDLFGDYENTVGDGVPSQARGIFNYTTTISSIDIVCSSTFNGGTALLYGVK